MTSQINNEAVNTPSPLVIEEYKEKRNYLRHTEDHDLKVLQWYFLVIAGSLALLFNKSDSLIAPLQKQGSIPLLTFLVLYSIFISLYLFFRKQNYNLFVNRLIDLEKIYCDFTEQSPGRTVFKVYRLRLIFVNLLGAGCIYLLAYALTPTGLLPVLCFLIYLGALTAVSFLGNTRQKGNG